MKSPYLKRHVLATEWGKVKRVEKKVNSRAQPHIAIGNSHCKGFQWDFPVLSCRRFAAAPPRSPWHAPAAPRWCVRVAPFLQICNA